MTGSAILYGPIPGGFQIELRARHRATATDVACAIEIYRSGEAKVVWSALPAVASAQYEPAAQLAMTDLVRMGRCQLLAYQGKVMIAMRRAGQEIGRIRRKYRAQFRHHDVRKCAL